MRCPPILAFSHHALHLDLSATPSSDPSEFLTPDKEARRTNNLCKNTSTLNPREAPLARTPSATNLWIHEIGRIERGSNAGKNQGISREFQGVRFGASWSSSSPNTLSTVPNPARYGGFGRRWAEGNLTPKPASRTRLGPRFPFTPAYSTLRELYLTIGGHLIWILDRKTAPQKTQGRFRPFWAISVCD